MKRSYFDFHLHPSFKPFLSDDRPDHKPDCWRKMTNNIPFIKAVLESQSCLDQMKKGNINLAVNACIAIEAPMTSSFLIRHVAPALTYLDPDMVIIPTFNSYFENMLKEIEHLKKSQNHNPAEGQTFQILKSMKDFDPDQLNVILAIEGGHNLDNRHNVALDEKLAELKRGENRFLYLTLTHLSDFVTATHCYGMKLIKDAKPFMPQGVGIKEIGYKVIDTAFDESIGGHKILIDIKHMSLVSRQQFYAYRREKYPDVPIIATHMGVTGISYKNTVIASYFSEPPKRNGEFVEVIYDKPRGIGEGSIKKTEFNPWSINLYDEEFAEIIDSDGLIGLSMDQRIMGASPSKGEIFSADELNHILQGFRNLDEISQHGEFTDEGQDPERPFNEKKHLRHFCNNLLHIIKIAGERAWDHVAIGSDFDGLVDAINVCRNCEEIPEFEDKVIEMLPKMMEEDDSHNYDTSDIAGKVRKLMFENAKRFLDKYFV